MIDRYVLLFLERRLYCMLTRLQMLLQTIKEWPREIYDIPAVIVAIRAELDKDASRSTSISSAPSAVVLMECLAELYVPLFSALVGFHVSHEGTRRIANQAKHSHSTSASDDRTCLILSEKITYSRTSKTKSCFLLSSTMNSWRSGRRRGCRMLVIVMPSSCLLIISIRYL